MKTIAVLTTTDSLEEARAIASALVERKIAACAQISAIESVYSWQGATQNDKEFRLMVKTVASRYPDVESTIRELHSYELPAVYALEMSEVFAPYADWVAENSQQLRDS
jgi:periplasmic divalent cation tolerance protein